MKIIDHMLPLRFGRFIHYLQIKCLRHRALSCRDESRRLEAARRLEDFPLLKQIALQAASQKVRAAAVDCIHHPAFLTAIALNTNDLEQGRAAMERIQHGLLLRRIARSACQESVRLLAAEKLGDGKMLKNIARSTKNLELLWQAARHLNDPELLAEVALYKTTAHGGCSMQREAHAALLDYLDLLARQQNASALLSFLWAQPNLIFKLNALLRLPGEHIRKPVLKHLARQKYNGISSDMIRQVLSKIESAGWRIESGPGIVTCDQCSGQGMRLKTACSGSNQIAQAVCPHCNGREETEIFKLVCRAEGNQHVVFELPASLAP